MKKYNIHFVLMVLQQRKNKQNPVPGVCSAHVIIQKYFAQLNLHVWIILVNARRTGDTFFNSNVTLKTESIVSDVSRSLRYVGCQAILPIENWVDYGTNSSVRSLRIPVEG